MAKKPRDVASRSEVIRIHQRLEQVVTKLDGGFCVYAEGVNDQTIADELKVGRYSVAGLRAEMFGKLRPTPIGADRLDELVRFTDNLLVSHNALRDRLNKLVQMLALNRVVDCKHLELK